MSCIERFFGWFFLLAFIFIPLNFWGYSWQFSLTDFIFSSPVTLLQEVLFGTTGIVDFSSDSLSLAILLMFLVIISGVATVIQQIFIKTQFDITRTARSASAMYLFFVLMKYGADKIFKAQFYLPEPNILYSQFGQLTRDTLFWSTMGLSHTYTFLAGVVELGCALLIIFRRTRVLGLLVSIAVFGNIIAINFGFNISVKMFSCFLFASAVFAIYPNLRTLFRFFCGNEAESLKSINPEVKNKGFRVAVKTFAASFLALLVFYPNLNSGDFNDDLVARPLLHGAYKIDNTIFNGDTLQNDEVPIEKMFVHRRNYLIFQQADGWMRDYYFTTDTIRHRIQLEDYRGRNLIIYYQLSKDRLMLNFNKNGHWQISGYRLDWEALPALQP